MAFAIVNLGNPENNFIEYVEAKVFDFAYINEFDTLPRLTELETHSCSDAELGLDDSSTSKFYSHMS